MRGFRSDEVYIGLTCLALLILVVSGRKLYRYIMHRIYRKKMQVQMHDADEWGI